jgi:hypothetical protein
MKKALFCLALMMLISVSAQTQVLKKIKIDRKMETQLVSLFDKKPQRIELYATEDNAFVVEASYEGMKLTKQLSADEYKAVLAKQVDKFVVLENARVPHLIGQTTLGLALYSWSVPWALFGDSISGREEAYFATMMLTPLAYAGMNFFLTRGKNITSGAAYGSFLGGIEGGVHGGIGFSSPRLIFPASLAENVIDLVLGQTMDFTPAMFQRKFNHAIYGYYHYFAVRALIADEIVGDSMDIDLSLSSAASALEGYASLFLSRRSEYLSYGDALFELRASEIGAQTIPLILATVDLYGDGSIDKRYYAAGSLAGFFLGYYIGNRCSVNNDLSGASGFLIYLLPALCYTAVGGVARLVNNKNFTYALPAVASVAEIGLTAYIYKSFVGKPLNTGSNKINMNFFINPAPLFCENEYLKKMPVAGLSWTF